MNLLRRLAGWIRALLGAYDRPPVYHTVFTEELPSSLEPETIYVCGEGHHLWTASLLCPCGCGEAIHLSLHEEGRPRWLLRAHEDGSVTLDPSVWRRAGCRSHFFIERGVVRWCRAALPDQRVPSGSYARRSR